MLRACIAALLCLASATGCGDDDPAPGIAATCERLTELCGEELQFEAGQCEALAETEPQPTADERRCIADADDCAAAMDCSLGTDGGTPDAGA